jgi:hypothetical protein
MLCQRRNARILDTWSILKQGMKCWDKNLVEVDLVSASAKSSKVNARWSGRVYFGVSVSLVVIDVIVALLKRLNLTI